MAESTTFTDFILNANQLNNILDQETMAINKYDLETMRHLLPEKQTLCEQNEYLMKSLFEANLTGDQKELIIEWLQSLQAQIEENLSTLDQAIDLYNNLLGIKIGKNININSALYNKNRKLGIHNIPITASRKL